MTNYNPDEYQRSVPTTSVIESVRSFGYDLNTAIADLIDNSISAHASEIKVHLEWNKGEPVVFISDNGSGMSEEELSANIILGSKHPSIARDDDDLGRFGLGMKTASLSMARQLNVFSKKMDENICFRSWDIKVVEELNDWLIGKKIPDWFEDVPKDIKPQSSGTLIIWRDCDRVLKYAKDLKTFKQRAIELSEHLGVIFSRFLAGQNALTIEVNGTKVLPWNPIPEKSRSLSSQYHSMIKINPYVLPHKSKFKNDEEFRKAGGIKGWNSQQGFYVYRNNRLIVNGGWLGLKIKRDEHTKLARIIVDIGSELDEEWQINVLKSRASIPAGSVRDILEAIAKTTRKEAEEVYRMKGKTVSRSVAAKDSFVWQITKNDNGLKKFHINREHPFIGLIKQNYTGKKLDLERLFNMIERLLPIEAIQVEQNAGELDVPTHTFEQTLELANDCIQAHLITGKPKKLILRDLTLFEPFSYYKDELEREFL